MLGVVLYIYSLSARFQDFRGANNYYDLWILDEFYFEEDTKKEYQTNQFTMTIKQISLLKSTWWAKI